MRNKLDLALRRAEQALTPGLLRRKRVAWQRKRARNASVLPEGERVLNIDLSVISRHDAGTGIQRVVRALALALGNQAGKEWLVNRVAARRQHSYCTTAWPDATSNTSPRTVRAKRGDVFLGLDFALFAIHRYRRQLARFRRNGGHIWIVVYDLLPIEHPDWFAPASVVRYKAWLDSIAALADGFFCISEQTEADLRTVLAKRYDLIDGFQTVVIPMGHDISESRLSGNFAPQTRASARVNLAKGAYLMVGTLEPRKGHAAVVDAFEELWRRGSRARLVIVGRLGWSVADLQARLESHPELGQRLLWFSDIDDFELSSIYHACQGVIAASFAEGFGLPVIEALGYGKPVLARDLNIFRKHEGHGVRYFPAECEPADLATILNDWFAKVEAGTIPVSLPEGSWKRSADVILGALTQGEEVV